MRAPDRAASTTSLYRDVLGPAFDGLAPVLRRFHGRAGGGRARGRLRVVRGTGPLARFAGWCISAPAPGEAVPVDMTIEVDPADGGVERWTRSFAGAPMLTRQWREGARLVEALGPSALVFDLLCDDQALVFVQCGGSRLLGIPLPRWLSPTIRARAGASEVGADAWEIDVEIRLPVLGLIVGYSGTMVAEPG